ncbi:MAG TPA: GGDEF domain-containing protein [Rubrobacteraceae bacterium]|nr:GGDEF domain-containing protein [Rubrobacteraceae bacterium]
MAAALFASVVFYVVTNSGSSSVVLALVISALVLFSLAWMYIRMGRQKNEHLRYHALHDSLTDLPNRSLFVDRVDQALTQADGSSASIAIMFVDLDDFKDINHSYGYETGDKLLVAVAERLTQAFSSDTLGRLGGDEFTVLLKDVSDINSAVAAADRLNKQLGAPLTLAAGEMLLSASMGITLSSGSDISTPESLLREANVAM